MSSRSKRFDLQTWVTENPNGISFWNECIFRLCRHKSVFPRTSARNRVSIVSIDTRITLTIAWRSVTFQRWINIDTTLCITRITLITITSSTRNWKIQREKTTLLSSFTHTHVLPSSMVMKRLRNTVKRTDWIIFDAIEIKFDQLCSNMKINDQFISNFFRSISTRRLRSILKTYR